MSEKLNAKIQSRKLAIEMMNRLAPELVQIFNRFKGRKVLLTTGGFSDKLKKEIDLALFKYRVENINSINIYWRDKNRLSLTISCRTILNGVAHYQEINWWFGEIRDQILLEIYKFEEIDSNFDINSILKARQDLIEARNLVSKLEGKLMGFGEFDC